MAYRNLCLMAIFLGLILLLSSCSPEHVYDGDNNSNEKNAIVKLPSPLMESGCSLEKAIFERVSRRSFNKTPLTPEQVAQLLWAAQGTGVDGVSGASRTAPSAGATHPVEIYLATGQVSGVEPGVYRYRYADHSLVKTASGDPRKKLAGAALNQSFVSDAPAVIVLAVDYGRTTSRYGERGIRYVHMEAGHITQNIYLQCEALNLGTVAVGAFRDEEVKEILGIKEDPLMIIPVGNHRLQ